MMLPELSIRQQALCGYILAYVEAEGWPPTMREIGAALGMTSTSLVNYHLGVLADKDLLERQPGARCIRLTPAGRDVAEAYLARMPKKVSA